MNRKRIWIALTLALLAAPAVRAAEAPPRSEALPVARPIRAKPIAGKAAPLPTAQTQPIVWRYTTEKPSDNWHMPDFDDSAWNEGPAGFGTEGTPGAVVRTRWNTSDIWLRRVFHLDSVPQTDLAWLIHFDEDAVVSINGRPAGRFPRWVGNYTLYKLDPTALAALKPGRNVIAVHCHQTYGGQYIDVGMVPVEAPDLPALPPLQPLFDYPVRDTCICLGPDGWYYLTGTTGHPTWWQTNEGIRVWKSKDLQTWKPLGLVWSIEKNGTWQKKVVKGRRAIWAPEIHYLKGTFWLAYCVN